MNLFEYKFELLMVDGIDLVLLNEVKKCGFYYLLCCWDDYFYMFILKGGFIKYFKGLCFEYK